MSRLDVDEYLQQQRRLMDDERWFKSVIERGGYCLLCGHPDDPMVIDSHHIAGRKNDPLTIPVCSNCHRHLNKKQRSWPKNWTCTDNPGDVRMALMLRGISDLLMIAARKLRELSDELLLSSRSDK